LLLTHRHCHNYFRKSIFPTVAFSRIFEDVVVTNLDEYCQKTGRVHIWFSQKSLIVSLDEISYESVYVYSLFSVLSDGQKIE
ncbi:hypothetical protein PMAYCL1PPCAC_24388, partial [Pristionchus mayeri]